MFFRKILSVFLFLAWGAVFNSICSAAPLMVEKNLFATDRKPPSPESADASAKPAKPGMTVSNFQLDGVIIESNGKRAILRMKSQSAGTPGKKGQAPSPFLTVREGQTVSDFRVSKIEPKSISLEKDGQTYTIGLFAENKILSPPSPAAPVPQPAAPPGAGAPEGVNQPPGGEVQPGLTPQNQPQQIPAPGQAPPAATGRAGRLPGRNVQNASAPAQEPVINEEQNQPAEVIEQEE